MTKQPKYRADYELRKIILFGAVGSSSLIFSILFLLFLGSQISTHHSIVATDTISEMMSYAEFFFFAFFSYFLAAILIWRLSDGFSKFVVSWLPISLIGSIVFSVLFPLRVWLSSILTFRESSPFQNPPPNMWQVALLMLICVSICFVVTAVGCAIISAITTSEKHDSVLLS